MWPYDHPYPRVNYLDALPEHWVVAIGPGAYWLVGTQQPWSARRSYRSPATALRRPSPATARLVLRQLGLGPDA
jgi:hypothetical protein